MTNARDLRAERAVSPRRRTYWCLEGSRKKPTDYEITSTALLYYPSRGFEVDTPVWRHYVEHQRGSRLRASRWDSFEDPAFTTYSSYVAERRDQEAFLDRLLERPASGVTQELRPLLGLLSALRFALHGQQMVAAYVGALAPSGRISVAAAFQAADEMRRIQRVCQWLWRSGVSVPELDALGRELWQQAPAFQPLRQLVERLLVTYDFGLALVSLNGVIKPIFDRLWFEQLAGVAERHHDEVLEKILGSLADDGRWHEMWFIKLSQMLVEDDPHNLQVMREQVAELRPRVVHAAHALLGQFQGLFGDVGEQAFVCRELESALDAHLRHLGLGTGAGEESLEART